MPDSGSPRVLIIDDDPAMAALIRQVIRSQNLPDPGLAGSGSEALAKTELYDIILLDHQLPDTTGIELLGTLRARAGRPSVILITGNGDEALAATALRLGADDYLIKDQSLSQLLPQVLERVRRTRALRSALAAAEQDLVKAERLAAIGELNVTLHHEINNPLMSASAEVELLIERSSGADKISLESIRGSIGRIRDVLKRVGELEEARSSQYVGDMGMIDLKVETRPRPVSRGDAIVWVAEEDLGRVLSLLLKHAGFTVRKLRNIEEVITASGQLGVSTIVVDSPENVGSRPMGGFRPPQEHWYTLVALVEGDGKREREAGADHTVSLPLDPGSFTEELLRAMKASSG
ncbi:MAG: response regulator [Gemmatimonadota bacterium]